MSALDIIASRFERNSTAESTEDAAEAPNAATMTPESPGGFEGALSGSENTPGGLATFLVAEFAPLSPLRVVIVLDRSVAEKVKRKFAGHVLWSAEELIFFMEKFFRLEEAPGTENSQNPARWCRRDDTEPKFDEKGLQEHFFSVCRAKATFNAFVSKREF